MHAEVQRSMLEAYRMVLTLAFEVKFFEAKLDEFAPASPMKNCLKFDSIPLCSGYIRNSIKQTTLD